LPNNPCDPQFGAVDEGYWSLHDCERIEGDPFRRLQEKRRVDYALIIDADNLLELRSLSK
jgi:hypothetical protein